MFKISHNCSLLNNFSFSRYLQNAYYPHPHYLTNSTTILYFFYPFIFDLRITQPQEQHKDSPRLFFFFPYISLARNCSNKRIWFRKSQIVWYLLKNMLMGNFLQEFDRSNGYVLFFISLPMVAYLRKLKQSKKW